VAQLAPKDRLQPSLFDRLLADVRLPSPNSAGELTEQRTGIERQRNARIMTLEQLKAAVLRDVSWLFSATRYTPQEELKAYSYVEKSVLNYGIADFSGATRSAVDHAALEESIRQALINFEPRFIPNSINVRVMPLSSSAINVLDFEIECVLWAQPVPMELAIRSQLDLDTGHAQIKDVGR